VVLCPERLGRGGVLGRILSQTNRRQYVSVSTQSGQAAGCGTGDAPAFRCHQRGSDGSTADERTSLAVGAVTRSHTYGLLPACVSSVWTVAASARVMPTRPHPAAQHRCVQSAPSCKSAQAVRQL
jgi:hypothetical protein